MLFEMDNSIVFDFRCTWWCSVTWRRGGADYLQGLQRHLDVLEFPQQVEGSVLQTQQHSIVTVGHTLQMNLSRCLICLIVRLLKRNDKASLRPWPTCVQTDRFVFGGRRLSSCWSRFVAMWRFTIYLLYHRELALFYLVQSLKSKSLTIPEDMKWKPTFMVKFLIKHNNSCLSLLNFSKCLKLKLLKIKIL